MTRDEQQKAIMQVKLEVESFCLDLTGVVPSCELTPEGAAIYAKFRRRMPDVMLRAALAVGMPTDDPWIVGAIEAWSAR